MLQFEIKPITLRFRQPAGTSRGVYTTRRINYLLLTDPDSGRMGIGECAPLPQLSCDDIPNYDEALTRYCQETVLHHRIDYEQLRPYPSILFGLETAFRHLEAGTVKWADTSFSRGETFIIINGLIWMGTYDEMYQRITEKIRQGFHCVKLKIGAIDFESELRLIRYIRTHFSRQDIELRVDANGAFSPEEALTRLEQLSQYDLHSIEQPIAPGQWETMSRLCKETPLPIALDEELIGINHPIQKAELLDTIKPQYIILKPTLHGGLFGADEWIELAQARGIGYWATSALESNVGLNAIAQWCSMRPTSMPQGLGTGQLFEQNIQYPLCLEGERLLCKGNFEPDILNWLHNEH